jgi:hypothetical protein
MRHSAFVNHTIQDNFVKTFNVKMVVLISVVDVNVHPDVVEHFVNMVCNVDRHDKLSICSSLCDTRQHDLSR